MTTKPLTLNTRKIFDIKLLQAQNKNYTTTQCIGTMSSPCFFSYQCGLTFLIRINASPCYLSKLCGIPKPITKSINLSVLTGFNKIQKNYSKHYYNNMRLVKQHFCVGIPFPLPCVCVCLFLKKKKKNSGLIITNENENFSHYLNSTFSIKPLIYFSLSNFHHT